MTETGKEGLDELVFVPLGGAGEIGMNLNLYGFGPPGKEQWVMVDLGVTFADPTMPGIDVVVPDPAFIEQHRDDLLGIVLTHAHEDHLGAVQYLWQRLQVPVYATPFAAAVLRRKLTETDFADEVPINEVPLGGTLELGPFSMELITLTHSIPEPNAIAIRTPHGTVLHTGDWKFDPDPVVGDAADEERLRVLGDDGVLAMIGDSTNVFSPGDSGSEADLEESLTRLVAGCRERVAVACFASNIARLTTIERAARRSGRETALVGRSLRRMVEAARETGYLPDDIRFLDDGDVADLPRDKVLMICTGSQGEPRAALARLATDDHPHAALDAGDTVIFSSRVIPGNETAIGRVQNLLALKGVHIITWKDDFVHVSGHPARDELVRMYQLVRPRIAVPVHGEARHLIEHASLARDCQVAETVIPQNGTVIRLAPGHAEVVDHAPAGRLVFEGNRLVPIGGGLVRGRMKALYNGFVVVTVALSPDGALVEAPQLSAAGLLEADEDQLQADIALVVEDTVACLSRRDRSDDEAVKEAVRIAVRRAFRQRIDKKPVTEVHLVRT